eukprot:Awhi_evm1s1046
MVSVSKCIGNDCENTAYYNYRNENARLYCGKCKLEGMVSFALKTCVLCHSKTVSYNYVGKRTREYCRLCKKPDMVNLRIFRYVSTCLVPTCKNRPAYNFPQKQGKHYCIECKTDDMVLVTDTVSSSSSSPSSSSLSNPGKIHGHVTPTTQKSCHFDVNNQLEKKISTENPRKRCLEDKMTPRKRFYSINGDAALDNGDDVVQCCEKTPNERKKTPVRKKLGEITIEKLPKSTKKDKIRNLESFLAKIGSEDGSHSSEMSENLNQIKNDKKTKNNSPNSKEKNRGLHNAKINPNPMKHHNKKDTTQITENLIQLLNNNPTLAAKACSDDELKSKGTVNSSKKKPTSRQRKKKTSNLSKSEEDFHTKKSPDKKKGRPIDAKKVEQTLKHSKSSQKRKNHH